MEPFDDYEAAKAITFSLTAEDIALWIRHTVLYTPIKYWIWARSIGIAVAVSVPISFIAFLLINLFYKPDLGEMALLFTISFSLLLLFQLAMVGSLINRDARKSHRGGTYEGTTTPATIALRAGGIWFLHRSQSAPIPWRRVWKVIRLRNHSIFIVFRKRPTIIIPASVFETDEDSHALYTRAAEYLRGAHRNKRRIV